MEQWLNPQALGAIGALIGAVVGALIAVLKYRSSTPIERKTAEIATTSAITSAGKTMVETAVIINERLENQISRMYIDFEYEHLKADLWEKWYNDLWNNWDAFRKSPKAPASPTYPDKDQNGDEE